MAVGSDLQKCLEWLDHSRHDPQGIAVLADQLAEAGDARLIREVLLCALLLDWEMGAMDKNLEVVLLAHGGNRSLVTRMLNDIDMLLCDHGVVLNSASFIKVAHVCRFTQDQLLAARNFGEVKLYVLRKALAAVGACLLGERLGDFKLLG